jgi:hypothetical protein
MSFNIQMSFNQHHIQLCAVPHLGVIAAAVPSRLSKRQQNYNKTSKHQKHIPNNNEMFSTSGSCRQQRGNLCAEISVGSLQKHVDRRGG